jgi:outer membrane immunogenic protein
MKRIVCTTVLSFFAASQAFAADLPPAPPPPPRAPVAYVPMVEPVFNWTGFYIGGNLGAAWSQGSAVDTTSGVVYGNPSSSTVFLGGGQVGANYQFGGGFVLGVEGNFEWAANTANSTPTIADSGGLFQVSSNDRWVTTLAARFGYAFDRVLFYGKAGGGWVGNSSYTVSNFTTGASVAISNSNTNVGWLVGTGLEWAFARNWTAKIEYDYLGLDSTTATIPTTSPVLPGAVFATSNRNLQMATVGINYLFH